MLKIDASRITLAMYQALVGEIVAERIAVAGPGYRYCDEVERCYYHFSAQRGSDGKGSRCLIGESLHRLGIEEEELERLSVEGDNTARSVLRRLGFTQPVSEFADRLQASQDRGRAWSEALALASAGRDGWDE